jgi:hypothetical protein
MKTGVLILVCIMFMTLPAVISAASFKVYPGAKLEEVRGTKQSDAGAKTSKAPQVIIFTTNDFFENVVSFYRGTGREYRVPGTGGKPVKLASGQELKEAYFILDNAADIMTSKHWIKIQRPYLVGGQTGQGLGGKFDTVRDVTAIIEEDNRTYP